MLAAWGWRSAGVAADAADAGRVGLSAGVPAVAYDAGGPFATTTGLCNHNSRAADADDAGRVGLEKPWGGCDAGGPQLVFPARGI